MDAPTTNANQMALGSGVSPKIFRAKLRRELAHLHEFGSWTVDIGSEKYDAMMRILKAMPRQI